MNTLSKYLAPAAFAALLALSVPAAAQPALVPVITVTGTAQMDVVPDQARIQAGVTAQAANAQAAAAANAKAMAAVIEAAKSAGIAEADMQTMRLSLAPMRENRDKPMQVTAFRASNQVTLRLRAVDGVANVIDKLIGAGATDIGSIEFVVSNADQVADRLRGAAVEDAKRKAELYAKAAGSTVGRAVAISEEGTAPPMPLMRAQAASAPAAMPVMAGESTLRVSVSVTYELRN